MSGLGKKQTSSEKELPDAVGVLSFEDRQSLGPVPQRLPSKLPGPLAAHNSQPELAKIVREIFPYNVSHLNSRS